MIRRFFKIMCFLICLHASATETKGFLTEDDISLFYKQGYVVKKQCLNEDERKLLQESISNTIERALDAIMLSSDVTLSDAQQFLHIEGSKIIFTRPSTTSISIARINGVGGMQPELINIARSEKMLFTFFELLGTRDLEHLIFQVHPKMPGDGIAFPRHQDIQFRKSFDPNWQDILGNGSYAICVIPVDPMNQENGGLWIDRNNYPHPQNMVEDRIWIDAQPGDLLFMHPHLFHGSGPNTSSEFSRKTLLTGFCAFGANHKSYPGACINMRILRNDHDVITMEPAPWHLPPSSQTGHL